MIFAPLVKYSPDDLFDDPYPYYADLRRNAPVHFYEPTGEWFVTRWSDCQTIGANAAVFGPSDGFIPMVKTMGVPNVLTITGNDHKCLRADIDAPLQQAAVDGYIENLARPIIVRQIAALSQRGSADLTSELFEPISVRCVADVMGFHEVQSSTLARWFHALNAGAQNVDDDPAVWRMLEGVNAEIEAAAGSIYERVLRYPDASIISHIVHSTSGEGQRRELRGILATLRVIILGGLQEPGHGAANAALGLLLNPDQATALAKDTSRLALRAYDEGLRWIAPIGVAARRASQSFTLSGVTIPAGAIVAAVLASANRDEDRWDNPDLFQIDRPVKPNASFGYRPHFCSGHYLSRRIGRMALEECFRMLPGLRLDHEAPPSTKGWRFRGAVSLPARWDA